MRKKTGFKIRELCGEHIITTEGASRINFNKLMVLNTSAAFLWNQVDGVDFDTNRLAELLVQEYGIDADIAQHDAIAIVTQWKDAGLIEESTV